MRVEYAAIVNDTKEVTLTGSADSEYWRKVLGMNGLYPYLTGDEAEIYISATDAVYKGRKFQDLSVSVSAREREKGEMNKSFYLLRAFNSVRFFAWVERNMYHTPYYYGDVETMGSYPFGMSLREAEDKPLHALMNKENRPIKAQDEKVDAQIFLPARGGPSKRKFYATLQGFTETFGFGANDSFDLHIRNDKSVFRHLTESGFKPKQWIIRQSAMHAKSKTYKR